MYERSHAELEAEPTRPPKPDFEIDLGFENASSLSQDEIQEALEWSTVLAPVFERAHRDNEVPEWDGPKTVEDLDPEEREKLRRLREFLEADLGDREFRDTLDKLHALLPEPFSRMRGFRQTGDHDDFDPTEHTIRALERLDATGLSSKERGLVRTALAFHDIGKVENPRSRKHPRRSKRVSEIYLEAMYPDDEEYRERILRQVGRHDMLGDVSRRDGENVFDAEDIVSSFPTEQDLDLHWRIVRADVSSIPGLSRFIPNIDDAFASISERYRRQEHGTDTSSEDAPLPFRKIDSVLFFDLRKILRDSVEFDNVKIDEEMKRRNDRYESLPEKVKSFVEKAIVQYSLRNGKQLLHALKMTGLETDTGYAKYLEEKYGTELPGMRMVQGIYDLTYGLWESNNLVKPSYAYQDGRYRPDMDETAETRDEISAIAEHIAATARELAPYSTRATHVTERSSAERIAEQGTIRKSGHDDMSRHFEGNGVYAGIIGSYRDWMEDREIEPVREFAFDIDLGSTLPIIVDYKSPKAMCNVLCESLFIPEGGNGMAHPTGLVEWFQNEFDEDEITGWKIDILEKELSCKTAIIRDEAGLRAVIADTNEPPIVWASLCRALRIRRLIPKSELYKIDLHPNELRKTNARLDRTDDSVLSPGVRIRGIGWRDLEERLS
ncbi:MAG: hypothetical protein HGA31_06710 [Candidatus Moranbacteria bacterium]|nr:hypothetical protein [Candidatus Moranbacteria bacterium]